MMITSLRDDPYLFCRRGADGHQWVRQRLPRRTLFGQPRDYRCAECGKWKYQIIDALGHVASQRYANPPGYRLNFPVTTEDVRLEAIRRAQAERRAERRTA